MPLMDWNERVDRVPIRWEALCASDEWRVARASVGRIDAQDTTNLVTIHQMHSQFHMNVHYDQSRSSILGLFVGQARE